MIVHAYDIEFLHRTAAPEGRDDCHGWCFGLPPGIRPEQWPLDPISGYPLMHGFTLRLPEDYRCHGPEIVALSFFSTAVDQNDGGARVRQPLYEAVVGSGGAPGDEELMPFHAAARSAHPRLHRMKDILDYEYAVILLTEEEFAGPFCPPPQPSASPLLRANDRPGWLASGALSYFEYTGVAKNFAELDGHYLKPLFGSYPDGTLAWNQEIRSIPRPRDPNAGKAPMEDFGSGTTSGYVSDFYWADGIIKTENYRVHDWAEGHKPDHIGGTMRPVQAVPKFSPYYIGFEEYFGGYNFGTGNAQLDFRDMKFDWACG